MDIWFLGGNLWVVDDIEREFGCAVEGMGHHYYTSWVNIGIGREVKDYLDIHKFR